MTSEETLTALIQSQSKANLQNTFMRLTDREVAVSLRFIDEEPRQNVMNLLPRAKAERIREEMRLLRGRIKVPPKKYSEIINHVIAVLQGRRRGNVSSYIKPKGN